MKNAVVKKLDNGITLIMENIEGLGTFNMGFFIRTGSMYESAKESGISHFIEHLMFKGTKNRTAKEITETVDYEGGSINAYTSRENTCYYIKMLTEKTDVAMDILCDMLLNSNFDEESIEKERNVIIEEIKMYEDMPEDIVHEKSIEYALRGVHSNSISGTPEGLKQIGRNEILKYLQDQYVAENMIISVVGTIDMNYLEKELNKRLKDFKRASSKRELDLSYKFIKGENLIKRETNQVHLCFNTRGISSNSEMKYSAHIISNILGGSMSSRLFQKIREERGLCYSVYSYMTSFPNCGLFSVYCGTTKEDYKEVIKMIEEEFENIRENLITEKELAKAKNQAKSGIIFGMENTRARMNMLAHSYIDRGEVYDMDEIMEKIEKISLDDIRETCNFMFDKEFYSHTVVGNIEVGSENGKN